MNAKSQQWKTCNALNRGIPRINLLSHAGELNALLVMHGLRNKQIQIGKCPPNRWVLKKAGRKPLFLFPFENFKILLWRIISSVRMDFLL